MNVVAYIRVSTDNQCGDDKFGLDVQRKNIMDYCAANGMEIGSHTDNHVELDSLSKERLIRELVDSKSILETITGQEITALCYPAGKYNADVEAAAADAGYLSAVTTRSGFSTKEQGMFALKRVRVSKDCGAAWIKSTLGALGY